MSGVAGTPALDFMVEDAAALEFAAVPTLVFRLRIGCEEGVPIVALALNSQLRIAVRSRPYDPATRARLTEVLGEGGTESGSIRSLFWTQTTLMVAPFNGSTTVELPIGCTFDFEAAVVKYLYALEDGEVPLEFLFSGTVYYHGAEGALRVGRIPWDREARYRLPIRIWRETLDRHYPDSIWLRLRRDTLNRLLAFRTRRLLPGWELAFEELLRIADERAAPASEVEVH